MATNVQRATTILNALVNGTATGAQVQKVGAAFTSTLLTPTESMTNEQKAEVFVQQVRHFVLVQVRLYEEKSLVETAKTTASTTVSTEFPEAP